MPPAAPPILRNPLALWAAWVVAAAALVGLAGWSGNPPADAPLPPGTPTVGPLAAIMLTLDAHLRAGWPAILLLIASVGLGLGLSRLLAPVCAHARDLRAVAPAFGVAVMLLSIVVLGTLGLLSTPTTWALVAVGLAGLAFDLTKRPSIKAGQTGVEPPPGWAWVGLPGIAILAVAAAIPPGMLWASEYGGYDTLSYHLQLPKEWIASGNTRPIEHNVYSFLPGAMEQAYAALASIRGAPRAHDAMLTDGGAALSAAHTLHAGITILAAGAVASLAGRLAIAAGANRGARTLASSLAGGLVLVTPWSVVVGSLAYNEMGVVLLGAGALMLACRRGTESAPSPVLRGALVGAMVGVACLVKPTALVFVGAPAGVLLLRFARLNHWPHAIAGAGVAGLLTIAPWLIRNAVMTGNPVFPLATELFGAGHWTAQQAARFAAAHAFDGSLMDRVSLLVFADPSAPESANAVARYRGISNTQWLLAFPAGVLGLIAGVCARRARPIAVGLAICLALQLAGWLAVTHLQSRFLIPCLIVVAPALGVGLGAWSRTVRTRRVAWGLGSAVCLLQALALWSLFGEQLGGFPSRAIGVPPAALMGDPYDQAVGRASPIAYLNHEVPPDAVVLLVGDATPLYHRTRVRYATVWDRPPLLDLAASEPMNARPDLVLINDAELARQRESGYLGDEMSAEAIESMVRGWKLVRAWPSSGVRLYRVPPVSALPEPAPAPPPTEEPAP